MYKKLTMGIILSTFFAGLAYASLFENDQDSSTESSSGRFGLLHHHEESSVTKQAAKAVACASIGKGICLGVAGAKYLAKQMSESQTSESAAKTNKT